MTSTAHQHDRTTPPAMELAAEIEQALLDSRALRADPEREDPEHRFTPSEMAAHERAVVLDATLALLIRHRLPIDADAATRAVREAESQDPRAWAAGCAEHVARIAEEKRR